jgi:hypothetical protein
MIEAIKRWVQRWMAGPAPAPHGMQPAAAGPTAEGSQTEGLVLGGAAAKVSVPFDENLLERTRTQWQFGAWASLAGMTQRQIQHHPDRANLALLAAARLQQLGQAEPAKTLTCHAIDRGWSPRLSAASHLRHAQHTRPAPTSGSTKTLLSNLSAAIFTGTPNIDRCSVVTVDPVQATTAGRYSKNISNTISNRL